MIWTAAYLIFPAAMAYAAASDLLTMTIPNRLSLILVAGFACLAPLAGLTLAEMGLHAAVGAAVLAVTFTLFALGWIGGGDAKIAAAIALWMGPALTAPYLVQAALFGGVLTLALLAGRRFPLPLAAARTAWIARLHAPTTGIPYGIALAAAALVQYPHSVWNALA
jgi:prepilin peptidase CpaA